jgi:hypothetical protein
VSAAASAAAPASSAAVVWHLSVVCLLLPSITSFNCWNISLITTFHSITGTFFAGRRAGSYLGQPPQRLPPSGAFYQFYFRNFAAPICAAISFPEPFRANLCCQCHAHTHLSEQQQQQRRRGRKPSLPVRLPALPVSQ